MEGRRRKNKFKEQRHQGKLSAFLRVLQEKEAWRKGSLGSGCGERLWGCTEHRWIIALPVFEVQSPMSESVTQGVGRHSALLVVKVKLCPRGESIKESYSRNYVPFHQGPMALAWQVLGGPKQAANHDRHHMPRDHTDGSGFTPTAHRSPNLGTVSSRLTSQWARWHSGKNQCNSGIIAN